MAKIEDLSEIGSDIQDRVIALMGRRGPSGKLTTHGPGMGWVYDQLSVSWVQLSDYNNNDKNIAVDISINGEVVLQRTIPGDLASVHPLVQAILTVIDQTLGEQKRCLHRAKLTKALDVLNSMLEKE